MCVCTTDILFAHLLKGAELIILSFGCILEHILAIVKNVYLLGVNDFLSWIRSGVLGHIGSSFLSVFRTLLFFHSG